MYARVPAESLKHYQECLPFLAINRNGCVKPFISSGQFNYCPLIWMFSSIKQLLSSYLDVQFYLVYLVLFSSIRSYRKINKLLERSFRLCHNDCTSSYDERLSKQGLGNTHIRNIQLLMIEIFKCQRYISPYYEILCYEMSHLP